MSVDISALVTANFPRTESELISATTIDYATIKTQAIDRAKAAAYGVNTIPDEVDIPDLVGRWIADKATIRLIPVAKDFYSLERFRSKSTNRGENVEHYDLFSLLDALREELEQACAESLEAVLDEIGRTKTQGKEEPQVSYLGPIVDATSRALYRGLP